jgi:arabinose-5-phosphate isomerase
MSSERKSTDFAAIGRRVLRIEAAAVSSLEERIGPAFSKACELILACTGRVVVTGMGKSGHVGGKLASTLASTGTPAFFVHPGEASHGDLGMITPIDLVVAISNSGETAEIVTILPLIKRLGIPLVTLTGTSNSTLGKASACTLDISIREEACPLNLAPTASTTAALAMGDALAVALLESRGFTRDDFARAHPGGTLGKRLLLRVEDVMRTGSEVPEVGEAGMLTVGLVEMSRKGLGMTTVVDARHKLLGIFTDGDLRRTIDRGIDLHRTPIADVMTRNCRTISPGALAAEAVRLLEQHRITALPVVDEKGTVVGALNVHDLLRAGVM